MESVWRSLFRFFCGGFGAGFGRGTIGAGVLNTFDVSPKTDGAVSFAFRMRGTFRLVTFEEEVGWFERMLSLLRNDTLFDATWSIDEVKLCGPIDRMNFVKF